MNKEEQRNLAKKMKIAFAKSGVELTEEIINEVLEREDCGSCWNSGCKDGCSAGCLSSCKTGNR